MRPSDGRFVGINDNVHNPPRGHVSLAKYGLEKTRADPPTEGDIIRYTITNADGQQFEFNNFFLKPETYEDAFQAAGFREFEWIAVSLRPSQRNNPFWDDFLRNPPLIAFTTLK